MRPTGNEQLNTRIYWDHVYTTPAKYKDYWRKTYRFYALLEFVKDGDKVIDLGCGVGLPCYLVRDKKKNCETWGVDISDEIIRMNKQTDPQTKWFQGYIGGLDFLPENYFDVVFCGEVIEHLDDPSFLFKDAYRILKKGGKLIITTPIESHVISHEHVWLFEKIDIIKLFHDSGFKRKVYLVDLPDMEHALVYFAIGTK